MGFMFYVHNTDGNIEAKLRCDERYNFTVHYPRYEINRTRFFHPYNWCIPFNMRQVGTIVMAINPSELKRLDKEFGEYIEKQKIKKT